MKKNWLVGLALIFSIIALVLSLYSFLQTGGFNRLKTTLLELEFKMETKKYLLEAKAHLIEAKALYTLKNEAEASSKEIAKAERFLEMAKLTAAQSEIKKIEEIRAELAALEEKIKSGQKLRSNFMDKVLSFLDNFLNFVKK